MPKPRQVSQRHPVVLEAELVADGRARQVLIEALSLGGAQLSVDEPLPMGAEISLTFRVPGPDRKSGEVTVEAPGKVAWNEPGSLGIKFGGLRAAHVWALGKYLSAVAAMGNAA